MCKSIVGATQLRNNQNPRRSVGLDIVRTIACLTVIGSHFFLYTDFNTAQFEGISMFLQGILSSIVVGSDLYMILTGFLCYNKTFGMTFYKSGIKVILSYIFFSILTIIAQVYIFHDDMTWGRGLMGILSFSTIPYAWYIEMWIGLFLMSPFLNIWYKALPSARMKLYLIGLLFAMTVLPDFFNRYGLYIVPQFWENIYPLAFYFTGCYIREYRPDYNKIRILTGIFLIVIVGPVFNLIVSYPTYLHIIGDRNGIFMAALAVLIFLACYDIDVKRDSIKRIFRMISLRSLDIFLCSAIFDTKIYPLFRQFYFEDQSQFGVYYFVLIPLIFCGCYIIASIKRLLFDIIQRLLQFIGWQIPLQSHG